MKVMICTSCHDYGRPAKKKRGSNNMAIAAWMVFPLGVPYTLWRMFSKVSVCKECDKTTLVDIDSIMGRRLISQVIGDDEQIDDVIDEAQGKAGKSDKKLGEPVDDMSILPESHSSLPEDRPAPPAPPPPARRETKRKQDPDQW